MRCCSDILVILLWGTFLLTKLNAYPNNHIDIINFFANNTDPVQIKANVDIGLLGFENKNKQSEKLRQLLQQSFSKHTPVNPPQQLPFTYSINYEVRHWDDEALQQIEKVIASQIGDYLKLKASTGEENEFMIMIKHIQSSLDLIVSKNHLSSSKQTPLVLILKPRKNRIAKFLPAASQTLESFTYCYALNGENPVQTWLSSGRYIIIDLSAGPCKTQQERIVADTTRDRIVVSPSSLSALSDESKHQDPIFWPRVGSLIVSALKHVLIPGMALISPKILSASKVLVPLVIMKGSAEEDPLEQGNSQSIDIAAIKLALQNMLLPSQELVLISESHNLHEHRQISVALAESLRSDAFEAVNMGDTSRLHNYIDSRELLYKIKRSDDAIAVALFRSSVSSLASFLKISKAKIPHGDFASMGDSSTAILPVYIFKLSDTAANSFEEEKMYSSFSDALLLLVPPSNTTTISQHIIAAAAQSLGGLLPPFEYHSGPNGDTIHNYIWSTGYHPFSRFSAFSELSELHLDVMKRNRIFAKVAAATDKIRSALLKIQSFAKGRKLATKKTAKGQVASLIVNALDEAMFEEHSTQEFYSRLSTLHNEFSKVAEDLSVEAYDSALMTALSLLQSAAGFSSVVEDDLDKVSHRLACCKLETHINLPRKKRYRWLLAVSVTLFVAMLWFLGHRRRPIAKSARRYIN